MVGRRVLADDRVHGGQRGQVLVLIALAATVLFGLLGLATDIAIARVAQESAQAAADAAAMAGADDLPGSSASAVADATAEAAANGFTNGTNGVTVSISSPPGGSGAHGSDPNSVRVAISRQVPTIFMRVLGIGSTTVTAQAVATSQGSAGPPCGLCVLSPTASGALGGNGNPEVTVSGAGVSVDSTSSSAISLNGNVSMSAQAISVVGGYQTNGNVTLTPTPTTGAAAVPDPLAAVPAPALSGPEQGSVSLNGNGSLTLTPGIYNNISINGNGTLVFTPGTYVITGSVSMNGNPTLSGSGITLYFTCSDYSASNPAPCNGASGAGLSLNGNPSYDLTAPTSGTYQGLTVFYDRGNTASLALNGNASDDFTGTIYAKSASATLNGNPGINQINSLIIVNTATLNGNGQLNVSFTASQNYPVPPSVGVAALTG